MKRQTRKSPLRLAFIGGSLKSAVGYAHRVACEMDGRWQLVAGCFSLDADENRETAAAYGVPSGRTHSDWCSLIEKEKGRIDAVVVLTPTPTHAEIVMGCLKAGVPVICEKALAMDVEESIAIKKVRDETKGFLAVTYNYSGYPMVRELRSLVRAGTLGKILHFQAEMPQEAFRRLDPYGNKPVPQDWRLRDGHVPTIYLDLGVHVHHIIYYITGAKPLEVIADQRSFGWYDVIDNVSCLCRYSEGIQGQIWFSKSALGHRNGLRFRIYGEKASAEWYQANPEEVFVSYADGTRQILDRASRVSVTNQQRYNRFKSGHPAGFVEAFANLYVDIADALKSYRATGEWSSEEVYGIELAEEGLTMLFSINKSFRRSRWILLSE